MAGERGGERGRSKRKRTRRGTRRVRGRKGWGGVAEREREIHRHGENQFTYSASEGTYLSQGVTGREGSGVGDGGYCLVL